MMGIDAEMFVKVRGTVSKEALRNAEHKLYALFGSNMLETYRDGLLQIIEEYEQDGPSLRPSNGETFIRIYLWTRFYGEGYERGDFRLIHDLSEALEYIFAPTGEVYYGGDSSGVCAGRFGLKERRALRDHWLQHDHAPYLRHDNPFMPPEAPGPMCSRCAIRMHRYGWGGGQNSKRGDAGFYAAYSCECGEKVEVRDDHEERTTRRERRNRFYSLRNQAFREFEKAHPTDGAILSRLMMEME